MYVCIRVHIRVNMCVHMCTQCSSRCESLSYVGKVLNQPIAMITTMAAYTLQSCSQGTSHRLVHDHFYHMSPSTIPLYHRDKYILTAY